MEFCKIFNIFMTLALEIKAAHFNKANKYVLMAFYESN